MITGTIGILYILVAAGIIQNHSLKRDIEDLYYQELISTLVLNDNEKSIINSLNNKEK
jgi:hypothetical protein